MHGSEPPSRVASDQQEAYAVENYNQSRVYKVLVSLLHFIDDAYETHCHQSDVEYVQDKEAKAHETDYSVRRVAVLELYILTVAVP